MELNPLYSASLAKDGSSQLIVAFTGRCATGGILVGGQQPTFSLYEVKKGRSAELDHYPTLQEAKAAFTHYLAQRKKAGLFTQLTDPRPLHQMGYQGKSDQEGVPITGYLGWLYRKPKDLAISTYYGSYYVSSSLALRLSHIPFKAPVQVLLNFTPLGSPFLSGITDDLGLPARPQALKAGINYLPGLQCITGNCSCILSVHPDPANPNLLQLQGYNHISEEQVILGTMPNTADYRDVSWARVCYSGYQPKTLTLDITSISPLLEHPQPDIADSLWQIAPLRRSRQPHVLKSDTPDTPDTPPSQLRGGEDLTDLF
jgi:hypothetical protein